MRARTLSSLIGKPRLLAHRVWRAVYDLRHPDHPWLSPRAIGFLDRALRPPMRGLEWGSGRSTAWFARRLGMLVSIEHDQVWHAHVRARLEQLALTNAECRLVEVPADPAERDAQYWTDPPYVRVVDEFADASLDLVLVDGLYRQACVLRALPKVAPGGYLAIDNARELDRLSDWQVPEGWPLVVWDARRFRDTAVWQRPAPDRARDAV